MIKPSSKCSTDNDLHESNIRKIKLHQNNKHLDIETLDMRHKMRPLPHKGLGGVILGLPTPRTSIPRVLAGLERAGEG